MTDNDIIKALECCNNEGCCDEKCPYYTKRFKGKANCLDKKEGLIAKALDLINRQKAEIERLQSGVTEQHNAICEIIKQTKTEARKEFAERLKEHTHDITLYGEVVRVYLIDRLLEEMESERE